MKRIFEQIGLPVVWMIIFMTQLKILKHLNEEPRIPECVQLITYYQGKLQGLSPYKYFNWVGGRTDGALRQNL